MFENFVCKARLERCCVWGFPVYLLGLCWGWRVAVRRQAHRKLNVLHTHSTRSLMCLTHTQSCTWRGSRQQGLAVSPKTLPHQTGHERKSAAEVFTRLYSYSVLSSYLFLLVWIDLYSTKKSAFDWIKYLYFKNHCVHLKLEILWKSHSACPCRQQQISIIKSVMRSAWQGARAFCLVTGATYALHCLLNDKDKRILKCVITATGSKCSW